MTTFLNICENDARFVPATNFVPFSSLHKSEPESWGSVTAFHTADEKLFIYFCDGKVSIMLCPLGQGGPSFLLLPSCTNSDFIFGFGNPEKFLDWIIFASTTPHN